jgi:hypothetical protein
MGKQTRRYVMVDRGGARGRDARARLFTWGELWGIAEHVQKRSREAHSRRHLQIGLCVCTRASGQCGVNRKQAGITVATSGRRRRACVVAGALIAGRYGGARTVIVCDTRILVQGVVISSCTARQELQPAASLACPPRGRRAQSESRRASLPLSSRHGDRAARSGTEGHGAMRSVPGQLGGACPNGREASRPCGEAALCARGCRVRRLRRARADGPPAGACGRWVGRRAHAGE